MAIEQEENKFKKRGVAFKQNLIGAGHSSLIHHVLTPSSALPHGFSLGGSWVAQGRQAQVRRCSLHGKSLSQIREQSSWELKATYMY